MVSEIVGVELKLDDLEISLDIELDWSFGNYSYFVRFGINFENVVRSSDDV